jgi:hypothetical protein
MIMSKASISLFTAVALLSATTGCNKSAPVNTPPTIAPPTASAAAPAQPAAAEPVAVQPAPATPAALQIPAAAPSPAPPPATANAIPGKPKIGIMKFEVAKDLNPSLAGLLYDTLTEQVVNAKKFTVVDWESIDRMLQYMAKSQPNLSSEDARKQAVNQLGIQQLYLGSAAKLGSKYFLSVKVLNLDLSVDKVEKEAVESEEQMVDAVASITARLLGLPPPVIKPAPAAEAKPAPPGLPAATMENPWINSLGMKFIPVPDRKTLMCIWETRVQDYDAFAKDTGTQWSKPDFAQGPDHPAVNVSWNDGMAFCEWLTEKEQKDGKLKANQSYRLPTDAEWSLAVGLKAEQGATPKDKDSKTRTCIRGAGSGRPPKTREISPRVLAWTILRKQRQ